MLVVIGCSAGQGEGAIEGTFSSPVCEMTDAQLEIDPNFFSAEYVEELLEIRIQDGSDFEDRSDGLIITVRDTEEVSQDWLGRPIAVVEGGLVEVSLYLNETCGPSFGRRPVNFRANRGQVIFEHIYAPTLDAEDVRLVGSLEEVGLSGGDGTEEGEAEISAWFRFYFNRGRPAQRFP